MTEGVREKEKGHVALVKRNNWIFFGTYFFPVNKLFLINTFQQTKSLTHYINNSLMFISNELKLSGSKIIYAISRVPIATTQLSISLLSDSLSLLRR